MKKPVLKECVGKLSDDQLDVLYSRFEQRLTGDMPVALDILSKVPDIDKWLCSAQSAGEFFEMLDSVSEQVAREWQRRNNDRKEKRAAASSLN